MESPSPTISLLVPFWNVPLRAMFKDCGHQEMGDDSVVAVSGEDISLGKTASPPRQVRVIRAVPSVVGPQGCGLGVN